MQVSGIIYNVNIENRIISLENGKHLDYYLVSNNLMKKFKRYLYKGNLVKFVSEDSKVINHGYKVYKINYFKEISVPGRYGKDVLYSKRDTSIELKRVLEDLNNIMFLDIEMSMPGYKEYKDFTPEVIQVGMIIMDNNYNLIEKQNYYVKPTKHLYLTDRCQDFLHITYDTLLEKGINYNDFYYEFKSYIERYNPAVVVFGKNDKKFLESSYNLNNLESLTDKTRFINLNQLLKNYYEMSNDPGLFNMYERMYGKDLPAQAHDALEDAYYTYLVFKKFKEELK